MICDTGAYNQYLPQAQAGNAAAMYNVGLCYLNSDGVEQDMQKAIYWWEKSAQKDFRLAIIILTNLYSGAGYGMEFSVDDISIYKNNEKFVKYAIQGDELGIPYCVYSWGNIYADGIGPVKKDLKSAVLRWMEVTDMDMKSVKGERDRSYSSSYVCVMKSCINIGRAYLLGGDGMPKNTNEALQWFKRAANMGSRRAAGFLVKLYSDGEYISVDEEQARYWLDKQSRCSYF